jgi:hypothetical protein
MASIRPDNQISKIVRSSSQHFVQRKSENKDALAMYKSSPILLNADRCHPSPVAKNNQETTSATIADAQGNDTEVTCWTRFCTEIHPCQDYFSVVDSNNRTLDIQQSFACTSRSAVLSKMVIWICITLAVAYCWYSSPHKYFLMAYLTTWCIHIAWLYSSLSVINSIMAFYSQHQQEQQHKEQQQDDHHQHEVEQQQPSTRVNYRIRATWILSELAVHGQMLATVMFWGSLIIDYVPLIFPVIVAHGGLVLFVLANALVIDRVPIKLTHWYGSILPVMLIFIAWNIVHSFATDIGNPNLYDSDPGGENNDEIYPAMPWHHNWIQASLLTLFTGFFVSPVLYIISWLLSIYSWSCDCKPTRRYYIVQMTDNTDDRSSTHGSEEFEV